MENSILHLIRNIQNNNVNDMDTALYNFYAASVVAKASLRKA